MSHFSREVERIKQICYANQEQVDLTISIKNYLKNHCDENINLDDLARVHNVSKFHLIRLFKRYYGTTPRQYLIHQRIARAKNCLSQGKTVTETCYSVGFDSLHSFSTLFKVKTGRSPSTFKKAIFDCHIGKRIYYTSRYCGPVPPLVIYHGTVPNHAIRYNLNCSTIPRRQIITGRHIHSGMR